MPSYVPFEFCFIVIAKSQFRLGASGLASEVEREHVVSKQILRHHVVKHWSYPWLCQGWVGETDYGLEISIENILFFFNISKFLLLDDDLVVSFPKSEVVSVEMSG